MRARRFKVPEDMLPFAGRLSPEERKMWAREWRHLLWHSPRYVAVFAVVALACIAFFASFMPAWEFTTEVWSRWIFGLGELVVVYSLAEFIAYGVSQPDIEERILRAHLDREKAEPTPEGNRARKK